MDSVLHLHIPYQNLFLHSTYIGSAYWWTSHDAMSTFSPLVSFLIYFFAIIACRQFVLDCVIVGARSSICGYNIKRFFFGSKLEPGISDTLSSALGSRWRSIRNTDIMFPLSEVISAVGCSGTCLGNLKFILTQQTAMKGASLAIRRHSDFSVLKHRMCD